MLGKLRTVALVAGLLIITAAHAATALKLPVAVAAAAHPVSEGQVLVKQGKFPDALAKFAEAQGAAAAIPQPTLRLFYQVTARLGSATALDGMQRYDAALEHADWANRTLASPQARQLPNTLKAAVHHMRGAILYHLKRNDDATAMFDQAATEGDKTAADWNKAITAPPISTKPADLVARADAAAQHGKPDQALLLYATALQQFDELGNQTAAVMERALDVALHMNPPPPIPDGAADRLKALDKALSGGAQTDIAGARDLLRASVIEVPWWSDGWKRLAEVDEKLGDLAEARGALRYYLKATSEADDRDAIEQRIASLGQRISSSGGRSDTPAPAAPAQPAAATSFDGAWSMSQVCPPIGNTLGYTTNFAVQVQEGVFHGETGMRGQPGFLAIDGQIAPDGAVGLKASGLIADDKAHTAGNAQPGTPFGYDVVGRVAGISGTGKRQSARACDWRFVKQVTTPDGVADISGNWTTPEGRIIALMQNGNQVSWTSCCMPGHEDLVVSTAGTFDGKTIAGTYHFREGQAEGSGVATYALAGDRLEGSWQTPDGKSLTIVLLRHTGEAPSTLTGKWTTVSGRTVTLTQNGDQVNWTTCCRQSHPNWVANISATLDGKSLVGTFHWQEGDKQGNGTAAYTLAGNQLHGELDLPGRSEPYRSVLTRQAEGSIAGKWTASSGRGLTLTQTGNQVSGAICCWPDHPNYSGDVSGTFDGKNYVGIFRYRDGDARGTGTFIYVLSNGQLEGSFKVLGGEETKSVLTRQ